MRKFKGIRALLWIMGVRYKKAPVLLSDLEISNKVVDSLKSNPELWEERVAWDERSGCLAKENFSVTKNYDRITVVVSDSEDTEYVVLSMAYVVLGVASSFYIDMEVKQLLRRRYLHNRTRFDYLFKQLTKTANSGDCLN